MMSSVVQSVVAYDLTGKNGAVGFVSLGMSVATILVAPFGGVIADRVSKKRLLLLGQVIIGLNFAAVGVLIVAGQITIFSLAASTFVPGTAFAFTAPARQPWIGELLPRPSLAGGIALQQVAMAGTRIIGPFLAGGLVALSLVGSGPHLPLHGRLVAIVVATLARLPPTKARTATRKVSVMGDMMLGVRHISWIAPAAVPPFADRRLIEHAQHSHGRAPEQRPRLMLLAVSFIGIVIAGFSDHVVLPGYLEDELHHSPKNMALMLGVGAISGPAGLPFGVFADHARERETLFLMGVLVLAVTGGTALAHATLVRTAPPLAVPAGSLASSD